MLDKGNSTNIINEIGFSCSQSLDVWCVQEYCNSAAVHVPSAEVQTSFSLSQNYPNPFNSITSIEYSVPAASMVSLKVYDMSGREVATLVNERKMEGHYSTVLNGRNLFFCPSRLAFFKRIILFSATSKAKSRLSFVFASPP